MQVVSWSELLTGLVIAGLAWYAVVIALFYRAEIRRLFAGKDSGKLPLLRSVPVNSAIAANTSDAREASASSPSPNPAVNVHSQVHELVQELNILLATLKDTAPQKPDALAAIAQRLRSYAIPDPALRQSIAQYIVHAYPLSDKITPEDIDALW